MYCVFLSSHSEFHFMLMDEKKHPTQWISNRNIEKNAKNKWCVDSASARWEAWNEKRQGKLNTNICVEKSKKN